ncbi:unnamed protein product [marine sediment metagenome]|uniref:Holin of 3TMs, for gene-transfer release n=1 Tax=marine sediment metagenome TaxID=412755 RepID=X0YUF2_9ZZZZ
MLPILASLLTGIGGKILGQAASTACDVIDQFVDDGDLAAKLKAEATARLMEVDVTKYAAQLEAQKATLVAEIQGESWLQRNWRPTIMMMFGTIIANNYIVFPYLSLFDATKDAVTQLQLPVVMWECLKLGLSGYIVGRSAEKIARGTGLKGMMDKMLKGSD